MLVPEGLVGLHRPVQLQLFSITCWVIDLDYCDIEWFALETNRDHSIIFEIGPKYCILYPFFFNNEGYSISSKGFLATVVDIMVIWIKFAHSRLHFSSLIPKTSMFTLTISCLTTSNLPCFMELTFQGYQKQEFLMLIPPLGLSAWMPFSEEGFENHW